MRTVILVLLTLLMACKSYKQDIMFQSDVEYTFADIRSAAEGVEGNYKIVPDDLLSVEVYTNDGERIIDPNFELLRDMPQNSNSRPEQEYLVHHDGSVDLPLVGKVEVAGLTLREVNTLLKQRFSVSYTNPYIRTSYLNKRVVVLGGVPGQVVPLRNENTSILEVLALAGGLSENAKADNIKVFRKDQAFQLNFGSISGWQQSNIIVQPGDIIYIEPVRKPLPESVREITPVLSFFTSIATLLVLIFR